VAAAAVTALYRRARCRPAEKPWIRDYLGGDALALNRRIQDAMEPLGILNPGSLFE